MKILPIINIANKNIKHTSNKLTEAYKLGQQKANLITTKNNSNRIKKTYIISKNVTKEVIKSTELTDLPYIAGALGLLVPIPLASPIMLVLGKLIEITVKKLHK